MLQRVLFVSLLLPPSLARLPLSPLPPSRLSLKVLVVTTIGTGQSPSDRANNNYGEALTGTSRGGKGAIELVPKEEKEKAQSAKGFVAIDECLGDSSPTPCFFVIAFSLFSWPPRPLRRLFNELAISEAANASPAQKNCHHRESNPSKSTPLFTCVVKENYDG